MSGTARSRGVGMRRAGRHVVARSRVPRLVIVVGLCLALLPIASVPRPAEAGLGGWTPLNGPFGGSIPALVVDPVTPSTVYAVELTTGVFKSTDGGASWIASSGGLTAGLRFQTLAIDPKTPSILYLGSNGGVFQSATGGASWHPINNGLTESHIH